MKWFKAIAGITAIFLLGVMTGVLGTGQVVKHRIETIREKGPPPFKPLFMNRLGDRLDLKPEQRLEVERILDSLQVQLRQLRQGFHPKVKAAFDNAFREIEKKLTPAQREKMEKLLQQKPFAVRMFHRHLGELLF